VLALALEAAATLTLLQSLGNESASNADHHTRIRLVKERDEAVIVSCRVAGLSCCCLSSSYFHCWKSLIGWVGNLVVTP
jgi:hypothetical protein